MRPMVEERRMLSTQPMQRRSSVFMMTASCAIPRQTERSPVSFQYMYASEDLVPAPSACMHVQYSSSPVRRSGTTLQKALGKRPLSTLAMAAWTSSLDAETPRAMYRSFAAGASSAGAAEAATMSGALSRRAPGAVERTRARRATVEAGEHIAADIAVVVTDIVVNLRSTNGRIRCEGRRDCEGVVLERNVVEKSALTQRWSFRLRSYDIDPDAVFISC